MMENIQINMIHVDMTFVWPPDRRSLVGMWRSIHTDSHNPW